MGLLVTVPTALQAVLESVARKERDGGDDHAVLEREVLNWLTRSFERVNHDSGSCRITSGCRKEVLPSDCEEGSVSHAWKSEVESGESPDMGRTQLEYMPVSFLKELLPCILSVHSGGLKGEN